MVTNVDHVYQRRNIEKIKHPPDLISQQQRNEIALHRAIVRRLYNATLLLFIYFASTCVPDFPPNPFFGGFKFIIAPFANLFFKILFQISFFSKSNFSETLSSHFWKLRIQRIWSWDLNHNRHYTTREILLQILYIRGSLRIIDFNGYPLV